MDKNKISKGDLRSNEDIVEELTKDLCLEAKEEKGDTQTETETNSTKSENDTPSTRPGTTDDDIDNLVEEAISDEQNTSDQSDVEEDEVALRDLESRWTEEEKQEHKDESQSLKAEGNRLFGEKNFKEASRVYGLALLSCPLSCTNERSVLYANRAACRMRREKKKEAIADCTKALELNPNYLKALLRRAQLYRETEKLDEALADYQRVLEIDGNILEARQAVVTLPEEIKDRNEKLKTEMMGKLKDLGNVILRPFGLSTENFNLVQDPNTGGYSINFQRNS